METGSGDSPSPPPRYNSPRSVLHVLKGLDPVPEASVDTVDRVSASPRSMATLVTMGTTEAAMPTGTKMEAPCIATEMTSTVMTIEMSLVASDNRNMESLGQVASDAGAVTGDVIPVRDMSSTVTVPGVNSVAPVPTVATVNGTSMTSSSQDRMMSSPVALPTETTLKPLPVPPMSPTVVVVAPSPGSPPEKSSPTHPQGTEPHDLSSSQPPQDLGSQSSLGTTAPKAPPAPDTLSYLDSASLMSGTFESLTGPGFPDDASSMGSDSEINGLACRKTDRFGFLGGNQYSEDTENAIPVNVARQREVKWLDMLSHWDKWLLRRFQKVKLRCRKGIPSSVRGMAWQLLSNSKKLLDAHPGKFEELERQAGDPKWLDVIEKDLHRQFPFHEMFVAQGGNGQQDLYRILKAYTIYQPEEGYCQAQAPVAAVLLMQMPAEQAFWCLVQICEKYLPGYYSAGLEAIQLDGEIFFALLRRASPLAYRHLKKYKIDPILYMTEWFMCIFSRTLPWASVLRVWDMFFCEGVKIIFRVGLVLLRNALGSVDKLRSCQGMYETMEKLRNLPVESMQEDYLVHEVINLPVTESLIERENAIQLKKWRETRGELQYKPSRRLHGSRAIYEEHRRMNPALSASASLLSLSSLKHRVTHGSLSGPSSSPAHSVSPLVVSVTPPPVPPAAQSQVVVSEGLHPALPSPTGNNMPLGGPRKIGGLSKEEKRKEKEREKQERLEKERLKQERERERKQEKEREKQEKEREKQEKERERKQQKERAKEEARLKKERKLSLRKKEFKTASQPPSEEGKDGEAPEASVLHDTYF